MIINLTIDLLQGNLVNVFKEVIENSVIYLLVLHENLRRKDYGKEENVKLYGEGKDAKLLVHYMDLRMVQALVVVLISGDLHVLQMLLVCYAVVENRAFQIPICSCNLVVD